MDRIKIGFFEVVNPFNQRVRKVPAPPADVHTIVFWSKNFAPFIEGKFGEKLLKKGFNLFFNFTINSYSPLLEPNIPSLNNRFDQLKYLCEHFDAININWRFDPICFYKTNGKNIENNLADFPLIAKHASGYGVRRCITSFMDFYPKIGKRIASLHGFEFIDPLIEKKNEIVLNMEKKLQKKDISLYTCCEKEIIESLSSDSNIKKSSCIPNDLFIKISGGNISCKIDQGQRVKNGCGCMVSNDIGSYHLHPCFHNCLFCYANPSSDIKK